MSLRKD